MSREYDFIKDLNKDNEIWKIGLRVIDSWIVKASNGNEHMELIFVDAKGDRVHAITRYKEYDHWKTYIEENKTYVMYNCHVFDNDIAFKAVDFPFKVVLGGGTKLLKDDSLKDIPLHEFCFKKFDEIERGKFKTNVLYEIIGLLHEVVKTTTVGSGKKPCSNIVLTDESGKMVDVTLWESYSVKLMNYLKDRKEKTPIILILTHAQCKLGDNGRPNLSNNWAGSKLLINLQHPAVDRFKSGIQPIQISQSASQNFSQPSSSSHSTLNDPFSNLSQVKTIAEFAQLQKDTYLITLGTTKKFMPNKFGWYYESCSKCTKSAKGMSDSYKCSCGEEVKAAIARYKVVVQVEHDGHKSDFVFWDSSCFSILGISAETLRKTMQEVGEDDPKIYPKHLDKLLQTEFAFRVKYQPYYRQSSISMLSRDENVISKIKLHMQGYGNDVGPAAPVNVVEEVPTQSSMETNNYTQCSNESLFVTQSLSACGENDLEKSVNKTPAKRESAELGLEDLSSDLFNTPQLSATKPLKNVKIE